MYVFYAYNHDKTKKFWRCRNKDVCKSRIHTSVETSVSYPTPDMTPEQLKKLLPYKKSEDSIHFYLPDNFVPGSIAFANFPVRPSIRKQSNKSNKRVHHSNWTQVEAKRIYVKKTMNLYHWTQPGLSTEFVRKIVSNSWDNMSEEEREVYRKQANGENGPLMVHPHLSLMYQCGQLGKFSDQLKL